MWGLNCFLNDKMSSLLSWKKQVAGNQLPCFYLAMIAASTQFLLLHKEAPRDAQGIL